MKLSDELMDTWAALRRAIDRVVRSYALDLSENILELESARLAFDRALTDVYGRAMAATALKRPSEEQGS